MFIDQGSTAPKSELEETRKEVRSESEHDLKSGRMNSLNEIDVEK